MIIRYNVTGEGRKRLAYELGKITLWEPVYAKAPTFAYKVGNYTVDKTGAVICPTGMTKDVLDRLISLLKEQGFVPESVEGDALTISIPKDTVTPDALLRLRQIICNKAALFERAFQANIISLEESDDKISFPWFTVYGEDGEAKAYSDLVFALCRMAQERKRITVKPYDGNNDKFTMRLFLVQLGMKGDEYKQTRKILLRHLSGNSAWRNGTPNEGGDDSESVT